VATREGTHARALVDDKIGFFCFFYSKKQPKAKKRNKGGGGGIKKRERANVAFFFSSSSVLCSSFFECEVREGSAFFCVPPFSHRQRERLERHTTVVTRLLSLFI